MKKIKILLVRLYYRQELRDYPLLIDENCNRRSIMSIALESTRAMQETLHCSRSHQGAAAPSTPFPPGETQTANDRRAMYSLPQR